MDENKNSTASTEASADQKPKSDDATSSETLSDIEEGANVSGTTGGSSESSSNSALEGSSPAPHPDGDGRADGSDTGGPM